MPTEIVHADWVRERVFLLRDRFDFPIPMTQPMGAYEIAGQVGFLR